MTGYNLKVYSNGGATFDRFTVIIEDSVYTMSLDPTSPQGFNQFCCHISEYDQPDGLEEVSLDDLPKGVIWAILKRAKEQFRDQ